MTARFHLRLQSFIITQLRMHVVHLCRHERIAIEPKQQRRLALAELGDRCFYAPSHQILDCCMPWLMDESAKLKCLLGDHHQSRPYETYW